MTALVTGATGALGSLMLRYLQDHNVAVYSTGRSPSESERYIPCDLLDKNAVYDMLRLVRPNVIYHFAGSFTGDFECDVNANVICTKNILEAIKSCDLPVRVVVCGSAAEYGMVLPEENPISEDRELRPISIYGLTKVMQTRLCEYYARVFQLDVVVARIFNLKIKNMSERLFVGRVHASINKYMSGEIAHFEFGDLESFRDYVGEDAAIEQINAIVKNGIAGEVYNIGSGVPTKVRDLLFELFDEYGVVDPPISENLNYAKNSTATLHVIYADLKKTKALMRC